MGRIKFDVSGQMFAIQKETIHKGPDSYLKQLCVANSSDSHVIDRPPEVFSAVMAFYQTGELHIPMHFCPGAFLRELKFWGINQGTLARCCYFKLQHFLKKQENRGEFQARMKSHDRNFHTCGQTSLDDQSDGEKIYRCLAESRSKLWAIVDHRDRSVISTIYFILSMLMVLLSIFGLAFSTVPRLQRDMTNCEKLDYMIATNMMDFHYVKELLEDNCDETEIPVNDSDVTVVQDAEDDEETITIDMKVPHDDDNDDGQQQTGFANFGDILETETTTKLPILMTVRETSTESENNLTTAKPIILFNNADMREGTLEKDFIAEKEDNENEAGENATLLKISNGIIMNQTFEKIQFFVPKTVRIQIPNIRLPVKVFKIIEAVGLVYFSTDLILRLSSCPSYLKYFKSIVNVTDILALVGSFAIVTEALFIGNGIIKWLRMIQLLQMLRSFRLFRLVDHFTITNVLAYSLIKNRKDVLIMIVYLIAGVSIFSTALYVFENKETVESIPDAMYWAIITMTTVGYGDLAPKSTVGRLVGSLCAVAGVMVFALVVPLVVNYFVTMYQYAELYERCAKENEKRAKANQNKAVTNCVNKNNSKDIIELKILKP